jgi:phenylacetate-CoA ligase
MLAGVVLGRLPGGLLLGRRFRAALRFADDAQWWSTERSRVYQIEQLRQICTLAYEKTRFYREIFDSAGFSPQDLKSPDDLELLPTIDKNTLRHHLEDMCAVSPDLRGVDKVSTGGSSGEPLQFYIGSGRSATEYAYLVASWGRIGYRLGIPQAVFRGQIVSEDRTGFRHNYDPILRRHYYSNFHMTEENIRRYLNHVETIGPCYLHVYPSSVAALANHLARTGGKGPRNVLGILAGSETVFPEDRRLVEDLFQARYLSWYGHSEKLVLATECEHSTDYHVWPTYGYFELVDEQGRRITETGKRGEIVGTGFINRVVPFIRYRTGDYALYVSDGCAKCGRQQPIINRVEGRWPQGGLAARDGSTVSMTTFNVHDDTFDKTLGYQFYQTTRGAAVLRVLAAEPLSESDKARILLGASARLQGQVELTLEIRNSLEQTRTGKQLRVISKLDGGANG